MGSYRIIFPDGFDDYAHEVESKGWLQGVVLVVEENEYPITFYDPVRLSQDVAAEISTSGFFFESNLVVLRNVDRDYIERAIVKIVESDAVSEFLERKPHTGRANT